MRKIINRLLPLVLVLFFTLCLSMGAFNAFIRSIVEEMVYVVNDEYETWGDSLGEEELQQYYLNNCILPTSTSPSISTILSSESEVSAHLQGRFSLYSNWNIKGVGKDVGCKYKKTENDTRSFTPKNISETDSIIQNAKIQANLDEDYYIGCGPLAMVSQFEFLARYAGYPVIAPKLYSVKDIVSYEESLSESAILSEDEISAKTKLAKEIFQNTKTYAIDPNKGTFTFPSEAIAACQELIESYGLAYSYYTTNTDGNGKETTTKHYLYDKSAIYVTGDKIFSLSSFSTKKNNLIKSIDRGMPVIWWTGSGAGDFSNHYMNIYGYEYWEGVDSAGNKKTHLMFKIRINWVNHDVVFMDSDTLDAVNSGFIFFNETSQKASIRPTDYNFGCEYNFNEITQSVEPSVGSITFNTKRLRTGKINHYDSTNTIVDGKYITMSPDRMNAGTAYIEYSTTKSIKRLNIELCWWGYNEGATPRIGTILIQYKKADNTWGVIQDLQNASPAIPKKHNTPHNYTFYFPESSTTFRVYVSCGYAPTLTRNKGRLIVGNIIAYYGDLLSPVS